MGGDFVGCVSSLKAVACKTQFENCPPAATKSPLAQACIFGWFDRVLVRLIKQEQLHSERIPLFSRKDYFI